MNSISNQILTAILIAVLLVFGGWGYFEIQNTKKYEAERIKENQIRIAERLAFNLSYPVWNVNTREINTVIFNEAWDENVLSIRIFDEKNELYTGTIREKGQIQNIFYLPWYPIYPLSDATVVRQILRDKEPIGTVVIYPNKEPLQLLIRHLSLTLFLKITILTIILAGIQFLILRKVIIKPLSLLKIWTTSVSSDKTLPPPNIFHSNEIDALVSSFSLMTSRLVTSVDEISKKNQKLIESESRIKSISNNFSSGMIYQVIIKPDGSRFFTYLSESVKTLYGITPEQGIADSSLIYRNIHPDDIENLKNVEDEAMKTLSVFKMELRMKQVSGIYQWSSFVSTPTQLEDGSVRWDGIEFDITDLKKTQEELHISQEKFAIAFNTSPDAIFITEQETGIIIEANDAVNTVFGYSREEVIGKTGQELNLYTDAAEREKSIEFFRQDGFIRNMEIKRKHRSGADLIMLLSVQASNINGKPCYISINHDITERKRAEEELRVSQEKFAIAFNSSPDAIVISEKETGIIIETNDAIENIFGYSREEVIGKTGLELNMYKDPLDRLQDLEVFQKNGYIRNREVTRKHKSGSDLTLILSLQLSNINGKQCFIATIHDITERKKMEEELRASQEKFAIAFNSNPDVIFISDQKTLKFIEVNQAISKVYGYSREEAIGKSALELNIFKDYSDREKIIDIVNQQGSVHKMEIVGKNKYGSDLNLLVSVEKSIIDYKPCFIITVHDITQRKQDKEKLREIEERYKSIISVSNTGAWEYHLDIDYLWCSPEYFTMLGRNHVDYEMKRNKNLQEVWLNLLHPDDRDEAATYFVEYLKNGSIGIYESQFRMKHANGSWVWIWSRGQTLRDTNGNTTNLTVGTHIDITESKLAQMELQKLNLDKDRFMSILGHDLRSPFNGIVGILDLLCNDIKGLSKEEIEELLKMADKSAHNASELLDDVLMWAMAQSGKMNFVPKEFNFKEDCAHVIEILQSVADSKDITIKLDSEDNLVFADKNMLDTILRNLISNALKFTNEGGEIIVSSAKKADNTTISIADNGVGIDPKDANKIFDKTQLFTSEGTNQEKGTGFGLKLCQEFVEKHGGKIWVESEVGKGTTFYFSLPNK